MGSALVTEDTVYFGDVGGWFYALDRATGAERWKLNSRAKDFPGAHPINVFMASPILVEGKLIVAGGTLEQLVAGGFFYRGLVGPRLCHGPRSEDRPDRVEVRRGSQARTLESPDHDQG